MFIEDPGVFPQRLARIQLRSRQDAFDRDRCERGESGSISIGVSGDGDSLSIGLGQFAHAIRRNLNMTYIIENNGVYGLTKGQFSASADVGTKAKKGEVNEQQPIDPVQMAMAQGGTFVARSFSGDKDQLVPLLKAAIKHDGFALIDVLSPCVTFNDHEDSTKSYAYTRQFFHRAVHLDYVPPAEEIKAAYDEGEVMPIEMHDGSRILLRKVSKDYNFNNRGEALDYIRSHHRKGEIVTGLLYIDESEPDMHGINRTTPAPLSNVDFEDLCPGSCPARRSSGTISLTRSSRQARSRLRAFSRCDISHCNSDSYAAF